MEIALILAVWGSEHKGEDLAERGARAYQEWRDAFLADPENRRVYEQESVKAARWLRSAERWYAVRRWLIRISLIAAVVLVVVWKRKRRGKKPRPA